MRWLFIDGDFLIAYLFFRGPEVVQTFWLEVVGLAEKFKARRIAIAWDDRRARRRALYPEYKKGRPDYNNWQEEKPKIKREVLEGAEYFPVRMGKLPELEADDLIWVWSQKGDGIIVSGDFDLWQCLGEDVSMWMPRQKRFAAMEDIRMEYGGNVNAMVFQKCLIGDRSDNIPGVEGIGERRARELWEKHGNDLFDMVINGTQPNGIKEKWLKVVLENREVVLRNWQLMKIEELVTAEEKVLGELLLESPVKFEAAVTRKFAAIKGYHLLFQRWSSLKSVCESLY